MRILAIAMFALLIPCLVQAGEFPVADRVIVEKGARVLHLVKDGEVFRTFKIALGIAPVGDKLREGDFRTPEGKYLLDGRNPNSDFFLSIHISYPTPVDWREAREAGYEPGGAIMIHGQPNTPDVLGNLLPDAGLDQWLHCRVQFRHDRYLANDRRKHAHRNQALNVQKIR